MPKSPGVRSLVLASLLAVLVSILVPVAAQAAPPDPPTGLTTVDVGDTNPRFTWNKVPGATTYRIEIADNPAFNSATVQNTVTNSYAPPSALPVGTNYWRVRVTTAAGTSVFSPVQQYEKVLAGPSVLSPADGVTLDFPEDPPTFSWTSLPGSRSYVLEVDDAENFSSPSKYVTTGTTWTITTNQDVGQTYYWRVRGASGTGGNGVLTEWSEVRSYHTAWTASASVAGPSLVAPANGATVTDIRLEWTAVPGADRYQVQASVSESFTSTVFNQTVYDTVYSPPTTLPNGSYWWRVRALDYEGDATEWSVHPGTGKPFTFTRAWPDVPTVVYPFAPVPNPPATQTDPPYFEWTPLPHASHYEVQVGTDVNFSPGTFSTCFTAHTIVTQSNSPGPGGCAIFSQQYGQQRYWRVRGRDDGTVLGNWSVVHTFVRQPEAYPTLVSPANGASVSVPTLDWAPLEQSDRYRLRIINSSDSQVVQVNTLNTSYTYTGTGLQVGQTYRWYVVGVGDDGVAGQFPVLDSPAWRQFTYSGPPAATGSVTLLTPADGASSIEMPSMTWTPYAGADRYTVVYMREGVPTEFTFEGGSGLRHPGFTYTDTLSPGTYQWRVKAFDGGTQVATSDWRTLVISDLAPATLHPPEPCASHGPSCTLTTSPVLRWDPVPYANYYSVFLAFDANFTNVYREYQVPFNWFRPRHEIRDSDAGEVYYWHVRPCITTSRCGPDPKGTPAPSQTFQKRSDPVLLSQPAPDAAVTDEPGFVWQPYLDTNSSDVAASKYRIQVSTVESFTTLVDNEVVDQPFYTPFDNTYPEGPLYWRVRAIDVSDNDLTWSEPRKFTYQSPPVVPTQPAHNASLNGQPTFSWQPNEGASRYVLEIYADDPDRTFSPAKRIGSPITTSHTSYTHTAQLPIANNYSWRVRREDGRDRDGPWNAGRNFNITGAAPTLVSPPQNHTFVTPDLVFDWNPVPRAAQYRIQTSNNNFSSTKESVATVMTTWSSPTTYAQGAWKWRVQALDASGNVIGTSPARDFTRLTDALPSAPRNLVVTPLPGRLVLRWQPPTEAGSPAFTSYEIRIERTSGPDIVRNVAASATTAEFAGLMNGVEHDVTIRAKTPTFLGDPATGSGIPNGCTNTPFSDVAKDHQFCDDIRWLYQAGVTEGSNGPGGAKLFLPTTAVSRQSMAAFLFRYSGDAAPPAAQPHFADVGTSSTFFDAVQWMWAEGLSFGTPNPPGKPLYKPTLPVTRGSMAAFVNRFDDLGQNPALVPQRFSDVPPSHTFYENIQWMWDTGLSFGYPNPPHNPLYKPEVSVSRQTMAAFLHRLDEELNS